MDWVVAIERNRAVLLRIVAGLLGLAELAAERMPRSVHASILRVLRPAESAVRRLIVIAAQGLTAQPHVPRPNLPVGKSSTRRNPSKAFQLFDPRKRFAFQRVRRCPEDLAPRVFAIDLDPLVPWFARPGYVPPPPPPPSDTTVSSLPLRRRLAAINHALADISHQARRLARWKARRNRMTEAKFRDPLRPGPPPGHRKRVKHEIDEVLRECHALAWNRTRPDTS